MFSPLQAAGLRASSGFDSMSARLVLQLPARAEWGTSLMKSLASSLMRVSAHFEQFIFNCSQIKSILSCQILRSFGPSGAQWHHGSLELCVIAESDMIEDVPVVVWWLPFVKAALMMHSKHDRIEVFIISACSSWQETFFKCFKVSHLTSMRLNMSCWRSGI